MRYARSRTFRPASGGRPLPRMNRLLAASTAILIAVCLWTAYSRDAQTGAHPAPYYVIDLSGGPNAASYPATPLDSIPEDLASKSWKFDKLILKWIEPGSFSMGQALETTPIHEVTLSRGFYMGVFELTQAQWRNVMGSKPFHFPGNPARPAEMISWEDLRGEQAAHDWPSIEKSDPDSFMGRLNARTDLPFVFDLPTEAQWEYACRAGTETRWSFGNDHEVASDYIWHSDNADDCTREVGTKEPNAWGLYDMHGNVWEWCLDRFGSYPQASQTDPTGAATGWFRVWRGGGWDVFFDAARSAHRNGGRPETRAFHVGCRVVMSPE